MLLALLLLFACPLLPLPGPAGRADALGWPRRGGGPSDAAQAPALGVAEAERLQEVSPPAAVQQLAEALAERQPRLRILAPSADAVLPPGPFRLRLQVDDWPLVDAGTLGRGPHLLVVVDDGEPLALTEPEVTLPELSPGSHRLTVMAARPWGEVVKSPGATAQIRLHRTAANPLSQPALGSPQLLPLSPGTAASEPLLLDWQLIDAPLQNLREEGASWRLRVTVNGDSFLVDRQTPLWLRGWRPGANALQLELLDGRGEPLNPPFNSLVREVFLDRSLPRPLWSGARLSATDLAILLGEAPPPAAHEVAEPHMPQAQAPPSDSAQPTPPAEAQAPLEPPVVDAPERELATERELEMDGAREQPQANEQTVEPANPAPPALAASPQEPTAPEAPAEPEAPTAPEAPAEPGESLSR